MQAAAEEVVDQGSMMAAALELSCSEQLHFNSSTCLELACESAASTSCQYRGIEGGWRQICTWESIHGQT
eukprot:scaffold9534_cov84-Skeletonema_menzelii.AAC.4